MYPLDTANINDGTTNHVYSLVKMGEKDISSVRREAAAPADQPALLTIKHREVGAGVNTVQESMIRFERVKEDLESNQGTASAQLVLRWPSKICSAAEAQKTLNELIAFMAVAGYKDKFTASEP